MELFQCRLAAQGVDLLAHGVRHLAEPSIENVENRLAGILEEAFLAAVDEAFLVAFLRASSSKSVMWGMVLSGRRCWSCFLNWSLRSSGKGINQSIR